MVKKDHAEDTAECTEAGGKAQKITLRDTESIFLGLFLSEWNIAMVSRFIRTKSARKITL